MNLKLVLFLFFISISFPNYACKCDDPGSIEESFKKMPFIIHGKVIQRNIVSMKETVKPELVKEIVENLKDNESRLNLFETNYIFEVVIEIKEIYKGNYTSKNVTIYTPINGASCGYRFEEKKEYIIYAAPNSYLYFFFPSEEEKQQGFEKENTFWTNHCTRTREFQNIETERLRELSIK